MWAYSPLLPATQQLSNTPPSVALNSPADTGTTSDTTPTFDFTGTDPNGDDVRYEVELSDSAYFDDLGTPAIGNSTENSGASGDVSIALPVGNVGDKLVVVVTINNQSAIGDNNGGTPLTEDLADYQPNTSGGHTISVFSRVLTGSEPATLAFTNAASSRWAAVAFIVRAGYDVAPSSGNAANTDDSSNGDISAPSISVANNSVHIVVATWDTSAIGTISTPSGYTLIKNANGGGEPLHVSYKNFSTGGATGSVACSNTEYGSRIAFSFSLKSRSTVLLDKVSGTDAGFANPDNGGDTDPFNSGENIQYTVQAGDALAVGTYYWRVRAKDPSGSNTWGAWSSVRSFEVTSGGSGGTATPSVATVAMSLIAPSIAAGAALVATVLSAVFSLQAPTPRAGGTIAPAVHVATFSIPAPTSSGGASVAGSALGAVFGVQAPTVAGGSVASPSVLVATFSAQTATASGGGGAGGTAEPTVAVATFSVLSPVLSGGANISPSALSLSFGIPALAVSGGANTAPSIANVTLFVPTPAESGGAVVSVAPVEVTIGIIDPALSGGAIITPAVGVATFTANEALASNLTPAEPSVAVATFSALTPSAVIGGATVIPRECVIGPYDLIFLPSSGRLAKRITGNFYLEL